MRETLFDLAAVPKNWGPVCLTIGNFDGVHRGHQAILRRTAERAAGLGAEAGTGLSARAVALIFDPHPMCVVRPNGAPLLLSSIAERARRFRDHGIDATVVLRFTPETAAMSPEDFVQRVMLDALDVRCVVVGQNFRFGCRQSGDLETLTELGKRHGFAAEAVPAVAVGGEPVSSTRVRNAVGRGDPRLARRLLGRVFTMEGPLVRGQGIGSRSTVPTLNLGIGPGSGPGSGEPQLPATGVYVTRTCDPDSEQTWNSITNVGRRPTFDDGSPSVETHLIEPADPVSLQRIQLSFLRRLRDERRFDSPAALREQILADIAQAERFFQRLRAVSSSAP